MKVSHTQIRFYSEIIPMNIYILNEFFNQPKNYIDNKEGFILIPDSLFDIYNKLLIINKE